MFILYSVIVGLAIGLASGGRLAALGEIRFRWAPAILAGFLAQIVLFTPAVSDIVGPAGPYLYVGSTLLVGIAVVRNLAIPGVPLIVAGAISNMAAILANGGYMPASAGAMESLGKGAPTTYSNSAIVTSPALELLTDRFALPHWLPLANVFSVGDALLSIGVVVLIVVAMRRGRTAHPSLPDIQPAS